MSDERTLDIPHVHYREDGDGRLHTMECDGMCDDHGHPEKHGCAVIRDGDSRVEFAFLWGDGTWTTEVVDTDLRNPTPDTADQWAKHNITAPNLAMTAFYSLGPWE